MPLRYFSTFSYDHFGQCVRCSRQAWLNINNLCAGKQIPHTVQVERNGRTEEKTIWDCPLPLEERLKGWGVDKQEK